MSAKVVRLLPPEGQTLEPGQGSLFPDKLRPFFYAVAGYGNTLAFAFSYAFHDDLLLLWVAGAGFHRVQTAPCIPEAGYGGKYWLQVCRKVFDFQVWQSIGCQLWFDEKRSKQNFLSDSCCHLPFLLKRLCGPSPGFPAGSTFAKVLTPSACQLFKMPLAYFHDR